ncbi:hypothetical protein DFH09DRAFT_1341924 [Mycena vulgaris]|nr:hypothetical protein DFH09DRAFT_1341924 [Mycena vulgaris]
MAGNFSQIHPCVIGLTDAEQQFFLIDYRNDPKNDVRNFWDTVDEKLAERREEMLGYPAEERDKRTSFLFECSLREHIKKFPIKKGGKRKPGKQIPAWQAAISRAVDEMEGYTMEDLAGEEEPEKGPGPDDDDNT